MLTFKWEGNEENKSGIATFVLTNDGAKFSVKLPSFVEANSLSMFINTVYLGGKIEGVACSKNAMLAAINNILDKVY